MPPISGTTRVKVKNKRLKRFRLMEIKGGNSKEIIKLRAIENLKEISRGRDAKIFINKFDTQ